MYCPYSKDATNSSDTLLYAKILLKRSELICLNLNIEDALLDVEEGFQLLNDLKGEERNLVYCKFLYAKSIYLDLVDYKEYEQRLCTTLLEKAIDEFNFSTFLRDKLDKYHNFLIQVFTTNKELIKSEFENKRQQNVNVNVLKANSKLPGASTSVELCLIEGKGRCTRATQTVDDGTVLFVEKPIVQWLRPMMYKLYCNNCFIKLQYHFMTCFNCIKVKYCSSRCRDEAWERYHSIECKFQECLRYLGYGHMVLRTMLLFDQDEMMSFLVNNDEQTDELQDAESENENVINSKEKPKSVSLESLLDEAKPIQSLRSKNENVKFLDNSYWVENGFPSEVDYKSFFSLFGDEKHLGYFQMLSFFYGVSMIGLMAERMKIINRDDRFYYIFHSALLSHILKINFNCYTINDHSLKLNTKYNFWTHSNDFTKIGIGVYLSSSIISHSCDYNSNKLSIGSKILIYTNQSVEKGEELTHTYGPSFKISSYKDRQSILKNGYLFDCNCNACKDKLDNYPNAFKCTFCLNGPLIYNQDYSNECLKCGVKDQDLNLLITKLTQIQEHFGQANDFLGKQKWPECKQKLDYCKKVLKSIFYSEQKLDHLYRLYVDYYEQREKYFKAAKYASTLARLQCERDGKQTLESVLYSIKSLSLKVLHFQAASTPFPAFNQQVPKKAIYKLRDDYNNVLEDFNQINSRQVKLVEDTYLPYLDCFEFVETFLGDLNVEI